MLKYHSTKNGNDIYLFIGTITVDLVSDLKQGDWLINEFDRKRRGKFIGVTANKKVWIYWLKSSVDNQAEYCRIRDRFNEEYSLRATVNDLFGDIRGASHRGDIHELELRTEQLEYYDPDAGELYYAQSQIDRLKKK